MNAAADKKLFFSRELSWLDFDSRVLDEAVRQENPLLERLKFVAISGGNLDEFFMVRIAGLRQLERSGDDPVDPAGNSAARQLAKARRKISAMVRRQSEILLDDILPALEKRGVFIRSVAELDKAARRELEERFSSEILPVLTPLAAGGAKNFPFLNSGAIEIAVALAEGGKKVSHAFVEVPEILPRFVPVESAPGRSFVLLEELMLTQLGRLFPKRKIVEAFAFRLTRDMEFSLDDECYDDLLEHIGKKLLQRRSRDAIRLELPEKRDGALMKWLRGAFRVESEFCYEVRGPLYLKQFFQLVALADDLPGVLEPPWEPAAVPEFVGKSDLFAAIREEGPVLIAPPFQSFDPVVRLLENAAEDPAVLAIKQTLYRVSGDSPVVHALERAARNGKQVTVVVELRARFDEGNNINWARRLDEAGAHVVYGNSPLKIHAKALLIVRREGDGVRRYVHLATGNYNDKTAKLYTDLGVMSCDEGLCEDAAALFNVLTGNMPPPEKWRRVAVSPGSLRKRLEKLIEYEIAAAKRGEKTRIVVKVNSFSDEKMVRLFHRAADAGVKVDMIVRGICCYRPRRGQENLRIVSIVDRFLEHSRVFCFRHGGEDMMYLASADLMSRNLDRRIELMFPLVDAKLRRTVMTMLEYQLADRVHARQLDHDGSYLPGSGERGSRSQWRTWQLFRRRAARRS